MKIVEKQIKFSSWKIHFQSFIWKYWFFKININILEYWSWYWYWFWPLMNIDIAVAIGIQTNIDIDIDLDLDFLEGKLLISILILKKKFWKILILNKNFILSHLWSEDYVDQWKGLNTFIITLETYQALLWFCRRF